MILSINLMRKLKSPKEMGDYIIDEGALLGKGTYGKIYAAYRKDSEAKLACKCISKNHLNKLAIYDMEIMKQTQKEFERQIHFHFKLNSKHIVQLYSMEQDQHAYYLFMEYCDSDVAKLLSKRGKLPEVEALDLLKQLCLGYQEIYRNNASHRDLKPENLLLRKGILKIADFGFVKEMTTLTESITRSKLRNMQDKEKLRTSTLCGTPQYIPPNVIEAQNNSKISYDPQKFDMWSIGVIVYFMVFGVRPFTGETQQKLYQAIQKKSVVFPPDGDVSAKTKQLILRLLNKDEQQRLEFKLLLKEVFNQETKQPQKKEVVEYDFNKVGRVFQTKLKYLEYLNQLMKLIYSMNTKYSFFRKTFKGGMFAYVLLTRLHETRTHKLQGLMMEQYSEALVQNRNRIEIAKSMIDEYQQMFYVPIRDMCVGGDGLENLLRLFYQTMIVYSLNELALIDLQLRKCVLAILRLRRYIDKKLKIERLMQTFDTQKVTEAILAQVKV